MTQQNLSILALDAATKTGWARWKNGDRASGIKVLPSTGPDIGRFCGEYADWLVDLLTIDPVDVVVFEVPLNIKGKTAIDTARKLMGLAVVIEVVCWKMQIRCLEQNVQQVRQHFVGRGNLPSAQAKAAVIEECRRRGWKARDDNEADAHALLDYAAHRLKVADYPTNILA